jgi:uncharacterized protein (TIGR01440 family)
VTEERVVTWEAIRDSVARATLGLIEVAGLAPGSLLVVGCSTSEVLGYRIGKGSSLEVGQVIASTLLDILRPRGIYLAAQGCEHINRSLVVEREYQERHDLEEVTVWPVPRAGGAFASAAIELYRDPVMVRAVQAQAGMDIGHTLIGMHIKPVAVPVRLEVTHVGRACLVLARSRPPLVGGERAVYRRPGAPALPPEK